MNQATFAVMAVGTAAARNPRRLRFCSGGCPAPVVVASLLIPTSTAVLKAQRITRLIGSLSPDADQGATRTCGDTAGHILPANSPASPSGPSRAARWPGPTGAEPAR